MDWTHEDALRRQGYRRIAGIDEVGRGSLAGPVVAAAVILGRSRRLEGVRDSKLLSERGRRREFAEVALGAVAYGFGVADAATVDRINVLEATRTAMRSAVEALSERPDAMLIDALELPEIPLPQRALLHGDRRCLSIAAASILAKVFRDEMMKEFDAFYPAYRFGRNKGYGTADHCRALRASGPSPLHRLTFGRVLTAPFAREGF
ncbi:MAG TPA: ribonuclease HII [Candidatus Polarisedimenticolia bacterium]|nr:ribonuclease HII [Candidatus Polarisedimenticolia bacterium]